MVDESDKSGIVTIERRELMQIAQQIHQGYHQHIRGTWRECPIGVCDRIRSVLGLPDRVQGAKAPPYATDNPMTHPLHCRCANCEPDYS